MKYLCSKFEHLLSFEFDQGSKVLALFLDQWKIQTSHLNIFIEKKKL